VVLLGGVGESLVAALRVGSFIPVTGIVRSEKSQIRRNQFAETLEGILPYSMQKKRAAFAAALSCVDRRVQ
jgi:hypothetical protein